MDPWDAFQVAVPWFVADDQVARASATQQPGAWKPRSRDFSRLFPRLDALLKRASITNVTVNDRAFVLFSWPIGGQMASWLCEPPTESAPAVCTAHHILLQSFGGIVERSAEPPSWLLNHNSFLTVKEASFDASFLSDYAWAFPGERVPIDVKDFYSVAREANGNTTLCQRDTADIILFAHDHSFDHVQPWRGLPEYTLYSLEGAPNFPSFVETIAGQWLTAGG